MSAASSNRHRLRALALWRLLAASGSATAFLSAVLVFFWGRAWAADYTDWNWHASNPTLTTAAVWLLAAAIALVVACNRKPARKWIHVLVAGAILGYVGVALLGNGGVTDPSWLAESDKHARLALTWSLSALQMVIAGVLVERACRPREPANDSGQDVPNKHIEQTGPREL